MSVIVLRWKLKLAVILRRVTASEWTYISIAVVLVWWNSQWSSDNDRGVGLCQLSALSAPGEGRLIR